MPAMKILNHFRHFNALHYKAVLVHYKLCWGKEKKKSPKAAKEH